MTSKSSWLIKQSLMFFRLYPDSTHSEYMKFYKVKSEVWDRKHMVEAYEIPCYYINAGKIPTNGYLEGE